MSLLLDELNEKQKEAVLATDSNLRIIAGAGSGKTRVVTTRIAYLIEECKVYPNRILAITFTNKAANEMKERVESMIGLVADAVRISTIHSFCVRLLREDCYVLGYPRNFTILDTDDQKAILKEAYASLGVEVKAYSYASMLSFISNNKTQGIDPQQARSMANFEANIVRSDIYAFYENRIKEMLAMDFDDLLIQAHKVLTNFPDVQHKWANRFDYIHVDEFQDVDALQYDIVKHLMKDTSYICVVGDPDQTIYTWRGAEVDIILNFEKDFPNTKTIILNQNYRSTYAILESANTLIKNNKNRIDKDLFTENKNDTKVQHFSAGDDEYEAIWVIEKIKHLFSSGVNYKDIAVLYRSNYLSRLLEKQLLLSAIPYRIFGGLRFYDRKEIKDALSYLRLLAPKSAEDGKEKWKDLAVKRIINEPRRGVGAKTIEKLDAIALEQDTNLYEVIKHDFPGKGKAKLAVEELVETIEKYRELVDELPLEELLDRFLADVGYFEMLEQDKEIERIENVKELLNDLQSYEEDTSDASLVDYLQNVSLLMDRDDGEQEQDYVALMSIHASKGLEFDNVFVFGVNEGIFPSERSVNEGGNVALEEERRLAYVAFTRAKERLFISNSSGFSYMLSRVKMPSRFVSELPDEHIEHLGYAKQAPMKKEGFQIFQDGDHVLDFEEIEDRAQENLTLKVGDHVSHAAFDEGVIVSIDGEVATIAFSANFGIKKIKVTHPALQKVGG